MSKKYFGTDGSRGRMGEEPITHIGMDYYLDED